MKRSSVRVWRRVALAAGVAGAVAGLGTVAASAASGPAAGPLAAGCTTAQLTAWLGVPGDGAAGSTYYQLELSDIGTTSCTLYGFPGVSGVASGGGQLGTAAGWNTGVAHSTVTLTPGETAHVVLQIVDVANYPTATCEPAAAVGLRIYPPNQTTSVVVPFSFEGCSAAGPVYLQANPVTAGTGIPGYSS